MSKVKEFAKKFGIYRKNGISEKLKHAQSRVDMAEQRAMEALDRMKQARDVTTEDRCSGELIRVPR